MTETIIIGGNPVRLSAGAGALIHYKEQFRTEYTEDYKCLQDAPAELRIEKIAGIGMQLLWAMAKAADKSLPPYIEWILQFDAAELASATQAAEALFISSLGKSTESSRSGGREFTAENLIAFSLICGLSVSDLDDMPLPMVIDTFDEWCRLKGYKEEEARPATQEDFDAL
jgi:hypothetical protein